MKIATRETLYYEHSAANPVTLHVKPSEWFEVQTQMNRGPDAELVPDDIRDLYNTYRSDLPTNRPRQRILWLHLRRRCRAGTHADRPHR